MRYNQCSRQAEAYKLAVESSEASPSTSLHYVFCVRADGGELDSTIRRRFLHLRFGPRSQSAEDGWLEGRPKRAPIRLVGLHRCDRLRLRRGHYPLAEEGEGVRRFLRCLPYPRRCLPARVHVKNWVYADLCIIVPDSLWNSQAVLRGDEHWRSAEALLLGR